MSESIALEESDALDIIRLLGEVALMEAPRNDRRTALLSGIAKLIDADSWAWATAAHTESGESPAHTTILHRGFNDEELALLFQATDHPAMARLNAPFFTALNETKGQVTRLRQQLDPDNYFVESGASEIWNAAGVGAVMLSARPTSDGQVSFIALYRRPGRELFTARESRIAHIILSEIPSLHEAISPAELNEDVTALSPRLRQTMNLLLQGKQRKEIADGLSLSIHTVGDYISEIYRKFEVHSQSELIRRFLVGDGGDAPR